MEIEKSNEIKDLQKSLKIQDLANFSNAFVELNRGDYLIISKMEVFFQKIGKTFKGIQTRTSIIPPFLTFGEETLQKIAFYQKKSNLTKLGEKKYPFPVKISIESLDNGLSGKPFSNKEFDSNIFSDNKELSMKKGGSSSSERNILKPSLKSKNLKESSNDQLYSDRPAEITKLKDISNKSKNKPVHWPNKKFGYKYRVILEFRSRKTPVFLYFIEETQAMKVFNFMLFKRILDERFDVQNFFKKKANFFYYQMAKLIAKGISLCNSTQKLKEEPNEKSEKPYPSRKIFDFNDNRYEKEPPVVVKENKINVEPKIIENFDIKKQTLEIIKKLRVNPLLLLINRRNFSEFFSNWLTKSLENEKTLKLQAYKKKSITLSISNIDIPQKLCFYKPFIDISLIKLSNKAVILKKTSELKIYKRLEILKTGLNINNLIEYSNDLSSYLSNNETSILWKPMTANDPLLINSPIDDDMGLLIEIYDEGGYSFLSNMAQNTNLSEENKKFVTHSLLFPLKNLINSKDTITNEYFFALNPNFYKSSNEFIERVIVCMTFYEVLQTMQNIDSYEKFQEIRLENNTGYFDSLYKTYISYNFQPKIVKNPEMLKFLEEIDVLDFEEKMEIFQDFSEEKLCRRLRWLLLRRVNELLNKNYLKSCGFFQNLTNLKNNEDFYNLLIELKQDPSSLNDSKELLSKLYIKGIPNEYRRLLWGFFKREHFKGLIEIPLKGYLKRGYGVNKDAASDELIKRLQVEGSNERNLYEILENVSREHREIYIEKELKEEFMQDFDEILRRKMFAEGFLERNKEEFHRILALSRFLYEEILEKQLIYSNNLLIILINLYNVISCDYLLFHNKTQKIGNSIEIDVFWIFNTLISNQLLRYFLIETNDINPKQTKKSLENYKENVFLQNISYFNADLKGVKGDLILMRQYLKEKLPDFTRLFELGDGSPIPLESLFSQDFLNIFSESGMRHDVLYRIWDLIFGIDVLEVDVSVEAEHKNSMIDVYKCYILGIITVVIRRIYKKWAKFKNYLDFIEKMKLYMLLVEDIDEFIDEVLFERREIKDFLTKKWHIWIDIENEIRVFFKYPNTFNKIIEKFFHSDLKLAKIYSAIAQKSQDFGIIEYPINEKKINRILHIYLHNMRLFHNSGNENILILEISYEKNTVFFEIFNAENPKIMLEYYEKFQYNPLITEIRLNIYESQEKLPDKPDFTYRNTLKFLKNAIINIQGYSTNLAMTGISRFISKSESYNFATSEINYSIFIEDIININKISSDYDAKDSVIGQKGSFMSNADKLNTNSKSSLIMDKSNIQRYKVMDMSIQQQSQNYEKSSYIVKSDVQNTGSNKPSSMIKTEGNNQNKGKNLSSFDKNPNNNANIMHGFPNIKRLMEDGEDYEEQIIVSNESISKFIDILTKPQKDLEALSKQSIRSASTSGFKASLDQDYNVTVDEFKAFMKNLGDIGSLKDQTGLYQSLFQLKIDQNEPEKIPSLLEFIISLVLQTPGSFIERTGLFFQFLKSKGHVITLSRFKLFIYKLYLFIGVYILPNELDNLIDNLLISEDLIERIPNKICSGLLKASITININKNFSQIFDIKDILLTVINKKHRIVQSKALILSKDDNFKELKELLKEQIDENPKIKDLFYFIEKNTFDQSSKNEILLKMKYFGSMRQKQAISYRLNKDFTVIPNINMMGESNDTNNERGITNEGKWNAEKGRLELMPLVNFLHLHKNVIPLDNFNFLIDRYMFSLIMERLPMAKYFLSFQTALPFIKNILKDERIYTEPNEKNNDLLGKSPIIFEIVVENQKMLSISCELNENLNFDTFEILSDYFILAHKWRNKLLENKETVKIDPSSSRSKIFDKEIKISNISCYMPLYLLILKLQKSLIMNNSSNIDPQKLLLYQVDFFRSHIYVHFPNKMTMIDLYNNNLFTLSNKVKNIKFIVLEYKLKASNEEFYITLDSMNNFLGNIKNPGIKLKHYNQLALYRYSDHSSEWLKAKVIRSFIPEIQNNNGLNEKDYEKKDKFLYFSVIFAQFPDEIYLKKPSEVIFYKKMNFFRLKSSKLKDPVVFNLRRNNQEIESFFNSFKANVDYKGSIIDKNNAKMSHLENVKTDNVGQRHTNSDKNEKISKINAENINYDDKSFNKVFETHEAEEDSDDFLDENERKTKNEGYFDPKQEKEGFDDEKPTLKDNRANIIMQIEKEAKNEKFIKNEAKNKKYDENLEENNEMMGKKEKYDNEKFDK